MACRTTLGTKVLKCAMNWVGHGLFWLFDGKKENVIEKVTKEWERILHGIGLDPKRESHKSFDCGLCFEKCSLKLKPGDEKVCDTVMEANRILIQKLGGKMQIKERLTDKGAQRCRVEIIDSE